jgi:hypothetical protein
MKARESRQSRLADLLVREAEQYIGPAQNAANAQFHSLICHLGRNRVRPEHDFASGWPAAQPAEIAVAGMLTRAKLRVSEARIREPPYRPR